MQEAIKLSCCNMRIVYNKKMQPKLGSDFIDIKNIAKTLYTTNKCYYITSNIDPLDYIRQLLFFGIKAVANPIIKEKKLIGYKFKIR